MFVSDDCARGNAKACAKLRDVCEGSECEDLDFEGAPLDENGFPKMDFDVVILGGTLGIFYGMALQLKGLKVCVVTPRDLKGQEQEWNCGIDDLLELKRLNILTPEDIDASVTTRFGGTRVGFKNREVTPLTGGLYDNNGVGYECYVDEVLNLGVSPKILIERVANRFKMMGGVVRERCPLKGVAVSELVGTAVDLGSYDPQEDVEPITAKLVLDCLGYASPIARQQRYGVKPDGICAVFGSCAGGYNPERNRIGDVMYTFMELADFDENGKHQYFWESFPVGTNWTFFPAAEKSFLDSFSTGSPRARELDGSGVLSDVKTT
jgi:hypothetical protein